jgi:radical SAM-linked protein
VAKIALRYGRLGRLRFASHRVAGRAFERALRRAAVPIAYSAGFTPHPRISYLGAAPTGAASLAEYLIIRLAQDREPASVMAALNRALPPELPILDAVRWDDPALGDLASRLTDSLWRFEFPELEPGAPALARAAEAFMALETYPAEQLRPHPGGRPPRGAQPPRLVDVRRAVLALTLGQRPAAEWANPQPDAPNRPPLVAGAAGGPVGDAREAAAGPARDAAAGLAQDARDAAAGLAGSAPGGPVGSPCGGAGGPALGRAGGGALVDSPGSCAILELVLRHATPAARPNDIFAALASTSLDAASRYRATRLAQGQYSVEAGVLADPFRPG